MHVIYLCVSLSIFIQFYLFLNICTETSFLTHRTFRFHVDSMCLDFFVPFFNFLFSSFFSPFLSCPLLPSPLLFPFFFSPFFSSLCSSPVFLSHPHFFVFLCSAGDQTQGLIHARKCSTTGIHLCHSTKIFSWIPL